MTTETMYIVRFKTAKSTIPISAELRDQFLGIARDLGLTEVKAVASGPQGPALSDEQLEDIKGHLGDGATAAVKIEHDGPGVWLILTDEHKLDIDWYHVLDADGPGQREREQAFDEAVERLSELGIEVK